MQTHIHRSLLVFLYYLPFLTVCTIIFYFSSLSNPPIPKVMLFPNSDKILHAIAFSCAGLTAALGAILRRRILDGSIYLEAWLLAVLYGAFDEIHQIFTPQRMPGIADWIADALGAALGILLVFLIGFLSKLFFKKYSGNL